MNEKQKHIVGELLKELHIDKAVESLMKNQTDHIAALTAENAKLREAIVTAVSKPHPTWCKARQGQECTCYQKELRALLEAK